MVADKETAGIDLLDSLDRIKEEVEAKYGKEEPSHVLAAMGYSPRQAGRVLRFSGGWETTEGDWSALLAGLEKVNRGMQQG